jgi:hypothetical protein
MSGAFREGKMEKNNLGLNYFDPKFFKIINENKIICLG